MSKVTAVIKASIYVLGTPSFRLDYNNRNHNEEYNSPVHSWCNLRSETNLQLGDVVETAPASHIATANINTPMRTSYSPEYPKKERTMDHNQH